MNFQVSPQDLLSADLSMGTVMLKVGDMKNMTNYYQQALGLDPVSEGLGGVFLGRGTTPLLHLAPATGLQLPSRGEAGLFHTAFLFENQSDLAATVATAAQYRSVPASRAAPTTWSARRSTSPTRRATASSSTGTARATSGRGTRPTGKEVHMDSLALNPQTYLQSHLTEESLANQRQSRRRHRPRAPAGRRHRTRPKSST